MNLNMDELNLLIDILCEEHARPGNPAYHREVGSLIVRLRDEKEDLRFENSLRLHQLTR